MTGLEHTFIAVAMLAVSFYAGRYVGVKEGMSDVWQSLLHVFKAKEIQVDDDLNMIVIDSEGNERKVN
jgi:hypothetical protein